MANERNVETIIDRILSEKGWIQNPENVERNVFKQEFKNKNLNVKKSGRPDYSLYDGEKCLAIIEAKKPNKNLKQALNQAKKYAEISDCKIVFAYDGNILKSEYLPKDRPLTLNDIEIDTFLTKDELKEFLKKNNNNIETNILNITQSELIKKFKKIDNLLKNSGLEAGSERFTNLSTLIFIKISNDLKKSDRWHILKETRDILDIEYINTIINKLNSKYKSDIFSKLTIPDKYIENLKKIMSILDELDFKRINKDVKGGAYEYFLSKYNAGAKDLAQYYTPRHLINFMVKFINPKIKDRIYDPFCGTGGMLIVAYNHILEKINNEIPYEKKEDFLNELKKNTVFGREFTKIASTAKMNMILIGDGHSNIERGDTFSITDQKKYNIILTNIPFGTGTERKFAENYGLNGNVNDRRFLTEPTAIMHIIKSLEKFNGKAGIIVPTGFLYRVYKNDRLARQKLIKNGLKFIINLPSNVFLPYTPSQTSILFLDNNERNKKKNFVSFFNLKNDGFTLNSKRQKIKDFNDFDKILLEYIHNEDSYEKHNFLEYLKLDKIEKNKFNLYFNDYKNDAPKLGSFSKYIKLCEIAKIFQGPAGTYMQQKKYLNKGELKVYEQVHVIKKNLDINNQRFITQEYSNSLQNKKFEIKNQDILVTMSGTVGESIIFTKNFKKGVISTALSIIRIENKNIFLPEFIHMLLQHQKIKEWLKNKIKGTANKGIRLENLKDILIPKLNIYEQLKKIDEFKKNNEKIKQLLELKEKIEKDNDDLWI